MTIDTKALRGLLEKVTIAGLIPLVLEKGYAGKANITDSLGTNLSTGTNLFDPQEAELIVEAINGLDDLLDAYEERDRLKAALVEIANHGRGEFPSLNNMADGFNAVQKIAEEALEPKRIIATPESEASND